MAEMKLTQTTRGIEFAKLRLAGKNMKNMFIKDGQKNAKGEPCAFFTLVGEDGEKTKGLISSKVTLPYVASGQKDADGNDVMQVKASGAWLKDLEFSWFTLIDDEGKTHETWLLHNHQSDGVGGADEVLE